MKKDISIQIIRVVAMLSIIVCHIANATNIKYLVLSAQFFNVGVYIFLLTSGYLYSNKKIETISFYKKRVSKILLPMYIFIIPVFIIQAVFNEFEITSFLPYLFNLQGILGGVPGAGHLWFLTPIFICYLLLPLLQKLKSNKKYSNIFFILFLIITIASCYINRTIGTQLTCILTFLIGYFYFDKYYCKNIKIVIPIILFIIAVAVRLLAKHFLDGTVFYDLITVGISQIAISLSIMSILKILTNKLTESGKILNILDKYSYYLYITHYFFMTGHTSVMNITSNFLINTLIMLILSTIYAILLYHLCNLIQKLLNRKVSQNS